MLDTPVRTLGKSKTFAFLQVFAVLAATLGIYAVQAPTANAYQVNTTAPTGTAGGTTTAITEPSASSPP